MAKTRRRARFQTWTNPNCPFTIQYDSKALREIGQDVAGGLKAHLGAVEVGGILLGSFQPDTIRIHAFEPIPCEYAYGPVFQLSNNDHRLFAERLSSIEKQDQMPGRQVVGWYHSRQGGDPTFSETELEFHQRYFKQPWQVLLLHRVNSNGTLQSSFLVQGESQPRVSSKPPAAEESSLSLDACIQEPRATDLQGPALKPVPLSLTVRPKSGRTSRIWGAVAAMIAVSVLTLFYLWSQFAGRPAARVLHLEAAKRSRIVELRWDKESVDDARQGRLEIRDGAFRKQLRLDRNSLAAGHLWYAQNSDVGTFLLRVERQDGTVVEGSTTLVAPSAAPRPPDPSVAPAATAADKRPAIPVPAVAAGPLPTQFPLAGDWRLESGPRSGSTAVLNSLSITITEEGGLLRGKLDAQYHSRGGADRIHFSFSGKPGATLYWTTQDNQRAEIQFTPIPNSPDSVEVTWQRPGSQAIFHERLKRVTQTGE
jgi:proteasome lid subunit RPN8/RPN11